MEVVVMEDLFDIAGKDVCKMEMVQGCAKLVEFFTKLATFNEELCDGASLD